jgi:glycogen(starch) synthase
MGKDDNSKKKKSKKILSSQEIENSILVEAAWEVCNQVGGIYTVIRSKVPAIVKRWEYNNYLLIGPYLSSNVAAVFEPIHDLSDHFGQAVKRLRDKGVEVHYGNWLITGRPKVVLLNPFSVYKALADIKTELWKDHQIPDQEGNELLDKVMAFGFLVKHFLMELDDVNNKGAQKNIIAHFHEWMAATALPGIRKEKLNMTTVFTTHATMLGRYLAMNDPEFYEHLPFFDWYKEAKHFGIDPMVIIERAAAHGAHVFTTVSEVTARECKYLLGRDVEVVVPNGLNIERFAALHEFQNMHQEYKLKIHQFVMGHFFQSYSFDLDNTLYFFTSGRYEYKNKGFDMTLEALARLNWLMKQEDIDKTVVAFFVTKKEYHSINPQVLQSRTVMEEVRQTCAAIEKQVGERLFYAAAASEDYRLPALNDFIDDYWKLRLRRTLQSWKSPFLPSVVTHNLIDDKKDDILNFLRRANLINHAGDKVKVVYHPDFISPISPLFGMEYGQFVRGCHLGVFPSYYEPWGYTPLECLASGVPAVTSDLSGFGDYVLQHMTDLEEQGIYVVQRNNRTYEEAVNQLTNSLMEFVLQDRRERITQRNRAEESSVSFGWRVLTQYYEKAYSLALQRK